MKVLVTGAAGLVGFHACEFFINRGDEIVAVDNNMRKQLFGNGGDTSPNAQLLRKRYGIMVLDVDIRSESMPNLIEGCNLIIHCASQPSHPQSLEIPVVDADINVRGTLNILEGTRQRAKDAVVIFCSTNKVYGENVHKLPVHEEKTRYCYDDGVEGVDETTPVDQTVHTPFGVSKLAADLYCQEYARTYGLKTGIFRLSCITGPRARAVEAQNWEPYFIAKNMRHERLRIFGYKGKQVRDIIDARDLVQAFAYFASSPRPGAVYNLGGGTSNSISLLESMELIESMTGNRFDYVFAPKREGDHMIYITNFRKFTKDYPSWSVRYGLRAIFSDLYDECLRGELCA